MPHGRRCTIFACKRRKAELAEANADADSSTIYTVSLASLDIDVTVNACWLYSFNFQRSKLVIGGETWTQGLNLLPVTQRA